MSRQIEDPSLTPDVQDDGQGEETVYTTDPSQVAASGGWIMEGPDATLDFGDAEPQPAAAPAQPARPAAPAQPRQPGPAPGQTAPRQTGGGPSGTAFEVQLPNGLVFRGPTAEAVNAAASAYLNQGRPQAYASPQDTRRGYREDEAVGSSWNDEAYYQTFAKNPRAALHMIMQEYLGLDDPAGALNASYDTSLQVRDRINSADFLANNPEFPASPENADLLFTRLRDDGVEPTAHNMEVAFRQMVREGKMTPAPAQEGGQQPPADYRDEYGGAPPTQPAQPSRGAYAPAAPVDRGGAALESSGTGGPPRRGERLGDRELTIEEYENLPSAEHMKVYMERRFLLRQGQNRR